MIGWLSPNCIAAATEKHTVLIFGSSMSSNFHALQRQSLAVFKEKYGICLAKYTNCCALFMI